MLPNDGAWWPGLDAALELVDERFAKDRRRRIRGAASAADGEAVALTKREQNECVGEVLRRQGQGGVPPSKAPKPRAPPVGEGG